MREPRLGHSKWMATLVIFVACGAFGACRHKGADGTTADESRRNEPQPITRKECSGGSAQTVDVNNDGRTDITHHLQGAKRTCSEVDLNFDGRPDLVRFYDADGTSVSFEQHDFDFDGKIDDNDYFVAGKLQRKELDTNFDGLIDTWLWCQGPLVQKAERARRKPGRIDTLESYQNGLLTEVQYDENNDGKIEKWDVYRMGVLHETRTDTNDDGKPDRTDASEANSEQVDERVSCDGTPLPPVPVAAPDALPAAHDAGVLSPLVGTPSPSSTWHDAGAPPRAADAGVPARAADAGVVSTPVFGAPAAPAARAPAAPAARAVDAGSASSANKPVAKGDAGR